MKPEIQMIQDTIDTIITYLKSTDTCITDSECFVIKSRAEQLLSIASKRFEHKIAGTNRN